MKRATAKQILVVYDIREVAESSEDFSPDPKDERWKSEASVITTLKRLGHQVRSLGLFDHIAPLVDEIRRHPPELVFNLVEEFNQESQLERNVVGLLELLRIPYTGCGSTGMMLCKNKALAKKVLAHHDIPTAKFRVFKRGVRTPSFKALSFPMIVKPIREEASTGIAQASCVDSKRALLRRVHYIHQTLEQDALVEEYVHGRELYVSVIGHRHLEVLPVRELKFRELPSDRPRLATFEAKWNPKYRKKWGINEEFADPLPAGVVGKINSICRKAYRALQMDGYGRIDLRLTPSQDVVILEANANPFLAPDEDFAESARKAGYPFDELVKRLVTLALHRPAA